MQDAVYEAPVGAWVDPRLCAQYGDTSQACVTREVAQLCSALAEWGCTELIAMESCPVQLSCIQTACPISKPMSGSACSAPGLTCTLQTWTCPGTTEAITSSWAECSQQNEWMVGMASIYCPDPPGLNGWQIAVIVAASAVLVIAVCVLRRMLRTQQAKPA